MNIFTSLIFLSFEYGNGVFFWFEFGNGVFFSVSSLGMASSICVGNWESFKVFDGKTTGGEKRAFTKSHLRCSTKVPTETESGGINSKKGCLNLDYHCDFVGGSTDLQCGMELFLLSNSESRRLQRSNNLPHPHLHQHHQAQPTGNLISGVFLWEIAVFITLMLIFIFRRGTKRGYSDSSPVSSPASLNR